MWIKYIELKNFQNIRTGLKAKEISIDFSNRENIICLFVGPNGIGKTSLLSCLTPFATLGNLDIRDANQLVVKGENGFKKIIICDGTDEYVIQHFYTASKETHTVKSYITLNGSELNPNGNVTSFKQTVSDCLGIDMDYLKLIRLGDNVTNLIKLKSTDRKNFMSKFLDSVDIYLKYHQKISGDVRDLKLIISHTMDKLKKLEIDDPEMTNHQIKELRTALDANQEEIDVIQDTISKIDLKIEELELPENPRVKIKSLETTVHKMNLAMESEYASKSLSEIEEMQKRSSEKMTSLHSEKKSLETIIEYTNSMIDNLYTEVDRIEKQIQDILQKSNLDQLTEYLATLHSKRERLDKESSFVSSDFGDLTKEEVDTCVVAFKNAQRILNITYEFGKDPVNDAVKLIREKKNIRDFVSSKLVAIEKDKKRCEKTYLDTIIDKYGKLQKPTCNGCFLTDLYDDIMRVKDVEPDTSKTHRSAEYYQMVESVYDNISSVISDELGEVRDIVKKLPNEIQKDLILDTFFDHICKCESIYNEKAVNQFMMEFTEYNNYQNLLKEIEDTIQKINIEREKSDITYLEESLARTNSSLEENKDKVKGLMEKLCANTEQILHTEKEEEELELVHSAISDLETVRSELTLLQEKYQRYQELQEALASNTSSLSARKKEQIEISSHLKSREIALDTHKELTHELKKEQEMYDDLLLIRSSTSNKDGIPLLFIQYYLENIKELANQLLDIVYEGSVYIQDFYITGDEFKIPFVKNGIEIPDISFASQGEQSFLSMAISFALSSENLKKYNIPLLDEVDSTFDSSNRERFLSIIEHQNDIIHCEQEFVISHNNMFSQYPVDVLDFGDLKNSKFDVVIH